MPCLVQAEPSNSADKGHEGYCCYMMQRLLPAMLVDYGMAIGYASVRVMLAMAPHRLGLVALRLERCTTAQLEGHLAYYYNRLLMVRTELYSAQRMGTGKRRCEFAGLAKCMQHRL